MIGVQAVVPRFPTVSLTVLIGATVVVAVVVLAARLPKRTVNIVGVK